MNKYLVLGVIFAILVIGVGVIMVNNSVSFGELIGSLSDLNPRVMGLIALPFIVGVFLSGPYLRRKNEERKWKNAILKTRAKKQAEQESKSL